MGQIYLFLKVNHLCITTQGLSLGAGLSLSEKAVEKTCNVFYLFAQSTQDDLHSGVNSQVMPLTCICFDKMSKMANDINQKSPTNVPWLSGKVKRICVLKMNEPGFSVCPFHSLLHIFGQVPLRNSLNLFPYL